MNPSQIPDSSFLMLSGCRPGRHWLKSPMTETCFAFGAHTAKCVPSCPSSWVGCEPSINGLRVCYGFPTVVAPVNSRGHEHFDSKILSMRDCSNLLVEPPSGKFRTGPF